MEISLFASKTLAFRDQLHMMHLSTKSYSEHIAIEELYKFILKWFDGFVEAWQGFDELIKFEPVTIQPSALTNAVFLVEDYVGEVLMEAKKDMSEDMETYGWAVNLLEEAMTECFRTMYKLKNLK